MLSKFNCSLKSPREAGYNMQTPGPHLLPSTLVLTPPSNSSSEILG